MEIVGVCLARKIQQIIEIVFRDEFLFIYCRSFNLEMSPEIWACL